MPGRADFSRDALGTYAGILASLRWRELVWEALGLAKVTN